MGQQMVGEVGARGLSLFGGQTLQLWRRSLDAWRVRLFYQKSIYLSIYPPEFSKLKSGVLVANRVGVVCGPSAHTVPQTPKPGCATRRQASAA